MRYKDYNAYKEKRKEVPYETAKTDRCETL